MISPATGSQEKGGGPLDVKALVQRYELVQSSTDTLRSAKHEAESRAQGLRSQLAQAAHARQELEGGLLRSELVDAEAREPQLQQALTRWWQQDEAQPATKHWYLPCSLTAAAPHQCNPTCEKK